MADESFDYPTMARALILGDKDTVARKTREGLDLALDPKVLIFKGLIPGMDVVGEKFRRNEYYVPQVLLSARAMYAGLDLLKPLITASARGDDYFGVVVIGTAQGDLHDIGKNLVAMMLEGAGFKVVNLGRDVAPEVFVRAVERSAGACAGAGPSSSTGATAPCCSRRASRTAPAPSCGTTPTPMSCGGSTRATSTRAARSSRPTPSAAAASSSTSTSSVSGHGS